MNGFLISEEIGKYVVWLWLKYIKRKKVKYEDMDFHYPNWLFLLIGCVIGATIVGVTLLYIL